MALSTRRPGWPLRFQSLTFSVENSAPDSSPCTIREPRDKGKMPGGVGKAESLELFLSPSLGQPHEGSLQDKGLLPCPRGLQTGL